MVVPITRGYVAIIDDCDADLSEFNWQAVKSNGGYYAVRNGPRPVRAVYRLHREIMKRILAEKGELLKDNDQIDHENRNTLDCRRNNLRIATSQQNACNKGPHRDNKSGFRGVSLKKGRWRSVIYINGKQRDLGLYDTPEEAASVYNQAALALHGDFAYFNEVN